jgi:hypothetical protein
VACSKSKARPWACYACMFWLLLTAFSKVLKEKDEPGQKL